MKRIVLLAASILLALVAQDNLQREEMLTGAAILYAAAAILFVFALRARGAEARGGLPSNRQDSVGAGEKAHPGLLPPFPEPECTPKAPRTTRLYLGLAVIGVSLFLEIWVVLRLWVTPYDLAATAAWVSGLAGLVLGAWLLGRLGPELATGSASGDSAGVQIPLWAEVLAFLTILAVAIGLRTIRLDAIPPGIFVDETNAAVDALHIMEGRLDSPFGVGWFETPTMYAYYLAGLFGLLGTTFTALKAASLIPAILTVAAIYPLGRLLFGPVAALCSMAFLAFARWHLTMSRWGWNELAPPLFQLVGTYFLLRGVERRQARDFALGGLALGLGMYTYLASRLVVAIIVAYLLYRIVSERGFLRRNWRGLVVFTLLYAATFAPLASTYAKNPFSFLNRSGQVSITNDIERAGGSVEAMLRPWTWDQEGKSGRIAWNVLQQSISSHLRMFHLEGDRNPRHNLPGLPMLDMGTAIFFTLGLGYALYRVRDQRRALLLLWIPITLAGGVLSSAGEAPQAYRTLGALPAVALLAGDALALIAGAARTALPRVAHGFVFLCVASVLVWAGWLNADIYFGRQAQDPQVWVAFAPTETAVAREVAQKPAKQSLFLSPRLYYFSPLRFIAYRSPKQGGGLANPSYGISQPDSDLPPVNQGNSGALFLLDTYYVDVLELFQRFYPGTHWEMRKGPRGEPLYLSVSVSADEIAALGGLTARFQTPSGEVEEKHASIDAGWPGDAPLRAEWAGSLAIPRSGLYDLRGEGGLQIEVDGQVWRGPRNLLHGLHGLRVVLDNPARGQPSRLLWQGPGKGWETVPTDALFATGAWTSGLRGSYYRGSQWEGSPVFQQISPVILFAWPEEEPWQGPFSVRFEGEINAPAAGSYSFSARADDGVRLLIDGLLIGEGLKPGTANSVEGVVSLTAGWHEIQIDYFQEGGSKALELWWSPPGKPRQVVPPSALRPPS